MRNLVVIVAATTTVLSCKARQPQSEVKAEEGGSTEEVVDEATKQAVQTVAAACGNEGRTLLREAKGGHVDFVAEFKEQQQSDHPDFFERATFAGGKWKLSTAVRDAKSPWCVAGLTELTTEQLVAALNCGIDPCGQRPEVKDSACSVENGQVLGNGVAFADLETCNQLAQSGKLSSLNMVAMAPPPSESRALPAGETQQQTAMALTGTGFTWANYADPQRNYFLVKTDRYGQLQFKPDTLYSWGVFAKLDWLAAQSWSGRLQRDYRDQPLYATTSPFGSFGYGDISIRIKLKSSGVKWKYISEYPFRPGRSREYCRDSDVDVDNTVIVRYWDSGRYSGLDYIICGLGPVDSWSWGTEEHYDEMNAEVSWINKYDYRYYELYNKLPGGQDWMYPTVDGNQPSAQKWQNNMSYHKTHGFGHYSHAGNRGLIHYQGSADEAEHFRTNSPVYFNPE